MTEKRKGQPKENELNYDDLEPEDDEVETLWEQYFSLRKRERVSYDVNLNQLRRQVAFAKAGLSVEQDAKLTEDTKIAVARLDLAIKEYDSKLAKLKPRKDALDKRKKEKEAQAQMASAYPNGKVVE